MPIAVLKHGHASSRSSVLWVGEMGQLQASFEGLCL